MTPDTIYQDETDLVDEILDSFYFSIEEEETGITDDEEPETYDTQSEGLSELESESDDEAGAFYALYGGGSSLSSSISSLSSLFSLSAPRERVDLPSETIEAPGIFANARDDAASQLDTYHSTNDSSLIFGHEDIPQVISASSKTCDEGVLGDDNPFTAEVHQPIVNRDYSWYKTHSSERGSSITFWSTSVPHQN